MSNEIINLSAEQAGQNADEQEVAQAPAATTKSPVDDKMEEQKNKDSKQAVNAVTEKRRNQTTCCRINEEWGRRRCPS